MPNFANVLSSVSARARSLTHGSSNTALLTSPREGTAQLTSVTVSDSEPAQVFQYANALDPAGVLRGEFDFQPLNPIQWHMASAGLASYANWYNSAASAGGGTPVAMPVEEQVPEPNRSMLKRMAMTAPDLGDARSLLAAQAEDLLGYTPLREELKTASTLKRVLARLEIEILEEGTVDAYKTQMRQHYATAGKMPDPTWRLTELGDYRQPVPEFVLNKAVSIKRELPQARFYVDQLAIDPFLIVSLEHLDDYMQNRPRRLDEDVSAYIEVWGEPKFESTL